MRVSFFAALRSIVGGRDFDVSMPAGTTVRSLAEELVRRWPALREHLFTDEGALSRRAAIYVDGRNDTQQGSNATAYDIVPAGDVTIGYRPSQNDRFFIGQIDELSIYDRALSAAEVAGMAGLTQPFDE